MPAETPPRAWGRPARYHAEAQESRNTPTCVGKTVRPRYRKVCAWKHPHVRGEDAAPELLVALKSETPPRAWGRLPFVLQLGKSNRNTPTCVGKTPKRRCRSGRCGKHPHVRGEDVLPIAGLPAITETPPRAWGRLNVQHSSVHTLRNTPTCVGKTRDGATIVSMNGKHPHVRGEDERLAMLL